MLGDSLGAYRIERAVATGGTGRIFFARHLESGEPVALKIAGDHAGAASSSLRREARLLYELAGLSPSIVSWRFHDLDASPPWLAMEWIDGVSLAEYTAHMQRAVRRASGDSASTTIPGGVLQHGDGHSLQRLLHVLQQLAAALASLHERGITHGDLSPDNVLLRANEVPVHVDFRPAFLDRSAHQLREVLTEGRRESGTVGYIAPELRAGEANDWRRDSYALGGVAWYVLTGAQPGGATPGEIERLIPQPELRQLLLGLLSPKAEQRTSAREAELALSSLRGLVAPSSGVSRRTPLPRTRLVGREPSLKFLRDRLNQARAGQGSAVIVSGEAGIGKSRLLNEIVGIAQRTRFEVVVASCADAGAARTANVTSPLADLFLHERVDAGDDSAPACVRARQLDAIFYAVVAITKRAPLLVVLDDLHWADDLTWAFARSERLARLSTLPICLLASYRSGESGAPAVGTLDTRVWSTLTLERLPVDDVRSVALSLLGVTTLPSGAEQWLHDVTAGNPLHVVECVRELRSRPSADGSLSERVFAEPAKQDVVESLLGVLRRRLTKLSPEARQCARIAAMFGDTFAVSELTHALSAVCPELPAAQALEELRQANVIENDGFARGRFSHNLFAHCSLEPVPGVDEQALGRELARYCESEGWGDDARRGAGFLAMLHALAGSPERAFQSFVEAARVARSENRISTARSQYLRALEQFQLLPVEAQSPYSFVVSDVHAELADLLQREARDSEAELHYERALALAPSELGGLKRAGLLRKRARGLRSRDRYPMAVELLVAARTELSSNRDLPGFWSEWIEVQLTRFWLEYYARRPFGDLLQELEPVILEHGTSLQQSDFYQCACASLLVAARYAGNEQACEYASRALRALRDSEHHDRLPDAHMVAGFPLLWCGPEGWAQAVQLIEQAERGALWVDDLTLLAQTRTYLALAHRRCGNVEAAEAAARAAFISADRINSAGYRGAALASLSWVSWKRGEIKACDRTAREARTCWREGALRHPFQAFLNIVWADALRLLERFDEARSLLAELLAPDLQALPPELEAEILRATGEQEFGDARAADALLQGVTRCAQLHGFI